jgi:hypothetical protein
MMGYAISIIFNKIQYSIIYMHMRHLIFQYKINESIHGISHIKT